MVLKAENLSLYHPSTSKTIFKDISFKIDNGETCLVKGSSGAGKTLLGMAVCGFLPQYSPAMKLEGDIEFLGEKLIQGVYNRNIGIVLENPYVQLSGLKRNVLEELAFPLECLDENPDLINEKIDTITGEFQIKHLLTRSFHNLSGGELQRVIIACALIKSPRFIFLDRFMTEIDTLFRPQLMEILKNHLKNCQASSLIAEDPWLLPPFDFDCELNLDKTQSSEKYTVSIDILLNPDKKVYISSSQTPVLSIESLYFGYNNKENLIDDFSFSLGSGEMGFFTGPNGSGKTTLGKIIAGILKPTAGRIILNGKDYMKMKQWEIMSLVGFGLQNPSLNLSRDSVMEELELSKKLGNFPNGLVETLGLDKLLGKHPLDLTQAEKKRLGVALASGEKRKVMILDEPTQYQDMDGFEMVADAIKEILDSGKALIIITHDPRLFSKFPEMPIILL